MTAVTSPWGASRSLRPCHRKPITATLLHMDTRLERNRVARQMKAVEAELAGVPDSQAKRAALDRIEDRYIDMMAQLDRRRFPIEIDTPPARDRTAGAPARQRTGIHSARGRARDRGYVTVPALPKVDHQPVPSRRAAIFCYITTPKCSTTVSTSSIRNVSTPASSLMWLVEGPGECCRHMGRHTLHLY